MARVWRDGQKRPVHVYRLVTAGTIEEKVFQRQVCFPIFSVSKLNLKNSLCRLWQVTKQGLGGGLMEGGKRSAKSKQDQFHFSRNELKDLFSFNSKAECDTHNLLSCPCQDPSKEVCPPEKDAGEDRRSCQLGGDVDFDRKERGESNSSNAGGGRGTGGDCGSMRDLMKWEHLKPDPDLFQDDRCLAGVMEQSQDVTFVFRNVYSRQEDTSS